MHCAELRNLYDLMIFVNVDDDTRLARRVRRDITERGRDVLQVLDQYERTVKPSFTQFILPTKQHAHIIVSPRNLPLMCWQWVKQSMLKNVAAMLVLCQI